MSVTAIVGINWGDEGKGRMVDYLSESYEVVVRYQGGNNAGHTVINEFGKFALNLLPSGIFRPGTINILGPGTVIDLEHLCGEIGRLQKAGVSISPENLYISDRAMICMPFHRWQDQMEEDRLGATQYGSTRRGISPVYGDKAMKKTLQMGDLFYPESLHEHLYRLVDWKNALLGSAYHCEAISMEQMQAWLDTYGSVLKPYITDVGQVLREALSCGKNVLMEAQLGALRDLDYGIYPYTSSSSPLAGYAPIGCGLPSIKLDKVVGVVKAYSSCVGAGPFVGELDGAEGDALREAGGEYGAATGRPRRVAYFDLVATKHGIELQGASDIALTKMDVLSHMPSIPVIRAYKVDGKEITRFPATQLLDRAEPVYETLPGWQCEISHIRKFEDLPQAAQDYVLYAERQLGVFIKYVSVGPEREQIIIRG